MHPLPNGRPSTNRARSLANRTSAAIVFRMITVATCSNPAEAMLLKSLLQANDIEAYVPDELTAQSAPHFSGSGIRVQVQEQHAEAAKRILDEAESKPGTESESPGE